jgi:plastocyanin
MHDNSFEPKSVSVTAGTSVEIELRNAGQTNHNFTSQALGVSTGPMEPGAVTTISLTVPEGTTQFVCTWHPGMVVDVVGNQ